jgi:hypothetical protein
LLSHPVEYQSEFALRYFNQGVAEGVALGKALVKSMSILAVLSARGVRVTPDDAARILACHDTGELGKWLTRAATAESISDVLD